MKDKKRHEDKSAEQAEKSQEKQPAPSRDSATTSKKPSESGDATPLYESEDQAAEDKEDPINKEAPGAEPTDRIRQTKTEMVKPPMTTLQRNLIAGYSVTILIVSLLAFLKIYCLELENEDLVAITRVIGLVTMLGAIGGAVHNLASISAHAGKGDLSSNWLMFYFCRPFIGCGVAVVTFFVLTSEIAGFSLTIADDELTLLGWAALAGLFAQPALDWLKGVLKSVFRSQGSSER
jgi:hypothetical protein